MIGAENSAAAPWLKRGLRLLFFALGAGLLTLLFQKLGLRSVGRHIALVGWSILPVFAVSFLWKCGNTLAWLLAFSPERPRPGFWRLFRAYLAGDVVNHVLPAGNLGGELAKPYLLRAHASLAESGASVVANKTVEVLSGLLFAAAGVGVALTLLPIPFRVRAGLVAVVLLIGLVLGLALAAQRNRPLSRLFDLLMHIKAVARLLRKQREAVARMDRNLAAFYGTHRGRFGTSALLHFGSRMLGVLETYLIVRLMGVDITFTAAFLLIALDAIVRMAFFFVPANIGTFEAGHAYLFHLLGMDPAVGLSAALIKRLRRLLWVGVGLVLLYAGSAPSGVPKKEFKIT